VNAIAAGTSLPVSPLLGRGMEQAGIIRIGHGDRPTIVEVNAERVLAKVDIHHTLAGIRG
jgi:hypothetical protein